MCGLGELPSEGHSLMVDISVEALAVRQYVRPVLWAEHMSHMDGVTPTVWQSMSREGSEYLVWKT